MRSGNLSMRSLGTVLALLALLVSSAGAQSEVDALRLYLGSSPGCAFSTGSGSPENAVTGTICDTYWRTDAAEVYLKTSGSATNTGWTKVASSADAYLAYTNVANTFTAQPQTVNQEATSGTGLALTRTAGYWTDLALQTAGVNRWNVRVSETAETGSNAGSDFQLIHRADDGASLGVALGITRASGLVTVEHDLSVSGGTVYVGADTSWYRSGVDLLGTSDRTIITRTNTTDVALNAWVSGESWGRLYAYADGDLAWGDGTATPDVTISRSAANTLELASGDALATSYTSGWAGSGYHLDYNQSYANQSFLELDRLNVRGVMSVYELLVHQIRATNGSIFVANTGKAKTVTDNGGGSYTIETETEHGFAVNDLIRSQRITGTVTQWLTDMTVTAVADTTHFTATLRSGWTAPTAGMEFVRIGNSSDTDRQGSIYLTADDTGAPYIQFQDDVDAWTDWNVDATIKGRIGNLNGACGYTSNLYGACFGQQGGRRITIENTNGVRLYDGANNLRTQVGASAMGLYGGNGTHPMISLDGTSGIQITNSAGATVASFDMSGNARLANSVLVGSTGTVDMQDVMGWAHASDTTYIDGGDIYTNTVTAAKISALDGGPNRLKNSSFETTWTSEWAEYDNGAEATAGTAATSPYHGSAAYYITWAGTSTNTKGVFYLGGTNYAAWVPYQSYVISFYARTESAVSPAATGMGLMWNTSPATTVPIVNPNLTTSWQRYAFRITWGASVEATAGCFFVTIAPYVGTAANSLYLDAVKVETGELLGSYTPALEEVPPGTIVAAHIAAGTITANELAANSITAADMLAGTITATQLATDLVIANTIRSSGATALATGAGFWLDATGTPTFRVGDPAGGHLKWDGTTLTIGAWDVGLYGIYHHGGAEATSGGLAPADYPFWSGATYANRATAPFRVTLAGALYATGATISGAITATSGSFTGTVYAGGGYLGTASTDAAIDSDGITIGSTGRIRGGATAYGTGNGWWLGYDGAYKFRVGDPSGQRMTWDGSDLEVYGDSYNLGAAGLLFDEASSGSDYASMVRWSDGSFIAARNDLSALHLQGPSTATINLYGTTIGFWGAAGHGVELNADELMPEYNNDLDLGTSANKWKDIWAYGTVYAGTTINVAGQTGITGANYGTCGSGIYSLDLAGGIVYGVTCNAPEASPSAQVLALWQELHAVRAELATLRAGGQR